MYCETGEVLLHSNQISDHIMCHALSFSKSCIEQKHLQATTQVNIICSC